MNAQIMTIIYKIIFLIFICDRTNKIGNIKHINKDCIACPEGLPNSLLHERAFISDSTQYGRA